MSYQQARWSGVLQELLSLGCCSVRQNVDPVSWVPTAQHMTVPLAQVWYRGVESRRGPSRVTHPQLHLSLQLPQTSTAELARCSEGVPVYGTSWLYHSWDRKLRGQSCAWGCLHLLHVVPTDSRVRKFRMPLR
jgi:hypothetical protein